MVASSSRTHPLPTRPTRVTAQWHLPSTEWKPGRLGRRSRTGSRHGVEAWRVHSKADRPRRKGGASVAAISRGSPRKGLLKAISHSNICSNGCSEPPGSDTVNVSPACGDPARESGSRPSRRTAHERPTPPAPPRKRRTPIPVPASRPHRSTAHRLRSRRRDEHPRDREPAPERQARPRRP